MYVQNTLLLFLKLDFNLLQLHMLALNNGCANKHTHSFHIFENYFFETLLFLHMNLVCMQGVLICQCVSSDYCPYKARHQLAYQQQPGIYSHPTTDIEAPRSTHIIIAAKCMCPYKCEAKIKKEVSFDKRTKDVQCVWYLCVQVCL